MTGGPAWPPVQPGRPDGADPASQATPTRPDSAVIRPIPAGSDGPSFDAIAMKSVLSRARDSTRFEAPEVVSGGPGRRPFPFKVLIGTLVTMMVLGIGAGLVYVRFVRTVDADQDTIVQVTQTASRPTISTPQEAVVGYFTALAAGDVTEALTFGPPGGGGSMVLLEPQNHARMPEASRPSGLVVLTEDPSATEVRIQYTLAGEQVSTSVRVQRTDTGSYQLARTTVTVLTQVAGGDNLPMFINGAEVSHTIPIEVVPGTYLLDTGLPFITYPESNSFTIQSLAYTDTTVFPVTPELTADGQAALLAEARSSLERCMASRELTPTGCPNAVRAPKPVVAGSVQWTLLNDPWLTFNPTLHSEDLTVATATVNLAYRVTMDFTDGKSSGNTDLTRNIAISATMLGRETADVTVRWGD